MINELVNKFDIVGETKMDWSGQILFVKSDSLTPIELSEIIIEPSSFEFDFGKKRIEKGNKKYEHTKLGRYVGFRINNPNRFDEPTSRWIQQAIYPIGFISTFSGHKALAYYKQIQRMSNGDIVLDGSYGPLTIYTALIGEIKNYERIKELK